MMATRPASRILTVKPKILKETSQLTFSAHDKIIVVLFQQLYIHIFSFSAKAMHLLKRMVVAHAMGPPKFVMTDSSTNKYQT